MKSTAAWGGQVELQALTHLLKAAIRVYSADAPPVLMGDEAPEAQILHLSYHKHEYTLGEHYNSVVPLTEKVNDGFDDEDE